MSATKISLKPIQEATFKAKAKDVFNQAVQTLTGTNELNHHVQEVEQGREAFVRAMHTAVKRMRTGDSDGTIEQGERKVILHGILSKTLPIVQRSGYTDHNTILDINFDTKLNDIVNTGEAQYLLDEIFSKLGIGDMLQDNEELFKPDMSLKKIAENILDYKNIQVSRKLNGFYRTATMKDSPVLAV